MCMDMSEKTFEKLKEWVTKNYNPHACSWTEKCSIGNYWDCFDDGNINGTSWAAYEVGIILGMDLVKPELPEDEE